MSQPASTDGPWWPLLDKYLSNGGRAHELTPGRVCAVMVVELIGAALHLEGEIDMREALGRNRKSEDPDLPPLREALGKAAMAAVRGALKHPSELAELLIEDGNVGYVRALDRLGGRSLRAHLAKIKGGQDLADVMDDPCLPVVQWASAYESPVVGERSRDVPPPSGLPSDHLERSAHGRLSVGVDIEPSFDPNELGLREVCGKRPTHPCSMGWGD